jgi:hypothetical protein
MKSVRNIICRGVVQAINTQELGFYNFLQRELHGTKEYVSIIQTKQRCGWKMQVGDE